MNIDKPLDEIIATKKAGGRRGGQGGGRRGGGNNSGTNTPRTALSATAPAYVPFQQVVGDKIVVSNLPEDVTEAQIKELFTSTVGPLKTASLAYDSKGKSKGVATIQFHKAIDATKAYEQYNKRLVDGKRPMKVEIIVDPSRAPPQPLAGRLGAAPQGQKVVSATVAAASGNARQAPRTGGTGGRRGGRGGARGERAPERPKPTAEQLDAEMSEFNAARDTTA